MAQTKFTPSKENQPEIHRDVFLVEFYCEIKNYQATGSIKIQREEQIADLHWKAHFFNDESGWIVTPAASPITCNNKPAFSDDLSLNVNIKNAIKTRLLVISPEGT